MEELFKKRLHVSKNVIVDFDCVLPFYKETAEQNSVDRSSDDEELTDTNTTFALPSKASAEKLVNAFFDNWHPLFPVVHKPSFQWDFDAMYTEKASNDPANLAQMWLILAIAARDNVTKVTPPESVTNYREMFLKTIVNSSSEHAISFAKSNSNTQLTS
jgi:Fungal specific transcription factor domain